MKSAQDVPDWVEKCYAKGNETMLAILDDPCLIVEGIAQGVSDAYEEKGAAYCTGYAVGTVAIAVAGDKGIDKLKSLGKGAKAAGAVDDVEHAGDAVKVADNLDDVADAGKNVKNSILSSENAEEIAFNATNGSKRADSVVLGKYGDGGPTSYTSVAKDIDAQYFQLDNWEELAAEYSDEEIWKINEKFLDIQTSSGREIYLSHNPADYIGDGSFYSKEIQYLIDNGYKFVDEGEIWHAIR